MELLRSFLLLLACILVAEAKTSMRKSPQSADLKALQVKHANAEKAHISPELEPESSEKFFKKDYPFDKRPVANPFHFKHPYPVIQDSNEYDKDYVKDENSDNGAWKAQETYDRLRAKLAKEKRDLAEALAKKEEEERELKEAMKRHDEGVHGREEATKKAEKIRHEAEEEKKRHAGEKKAHDEKAHGREEDVHVSTADTEKAMHDLKDCKKQLAEARERLKKLMDELEEAKKKQSAANAALDEALKRELSEREAHVSSKKKVESEYEEYEDAKRAYLKQKALVEKLEADIKVAASKVKTMRDSADADGGVYPSEPAHSSAPASQWLSALLLAAYCVASV